MQAMKTRIEIVEANIFVLRCDIDMLVKEVREIYTCMKGMECMLQELAGGKKEMSLFGRDETYSSGVVLSTPEGMDTLNPTFITQLSRSQENMLVVSLMTMQ